MLFQMRTLNLKIKAKTLENPNASSARYELVNLYNKKKTIEQTISKLTICGSKKQNYLLLNNADIICATLSSLVNLRE